jgi:HSP20 family protein
MTAQSSTKTLIPTIQRSAAQAFAPLHREFNRLFDELGSGWEAFTDMRVLPSMDVLDTKDGLEINVELPGLKREEIKISVDGDLLTVSGEKKAETESKQRNFRVVERSYGEFTRSLYLPRTIDASKITASMSDGVLKITAPRRSDAETKTVEIQSA